MCRFGVLGSGFRVQGLGVLGFWGSGFRVLGFWCLGFGVEGFRRVAQRRKYLATPCTYESTFPSSCGTLLKTMLSKSRHDKGLILPAPAAEVWYAACPMYMLAQDKKT